MLVSGHWFIPWWRTCSRRSLWPLVLMSLLPWACQSSGGRHERIKENKEVTEAKESVTFCSFPILVPPGASRRSWPRGVHRHRRRPLLPEHGPATAAYRLRTLRERRL